MLYLWDEADEHGSVGHSETGVEGCEHDGQDSGLLRLCESGSRRIVTYKMAHTVDKGIEQTQHPDDAKDIEYQMCHGCAPCLRVGTSSSEVGGGCRADVLS